MNIIVTGGCGFIGTNFVRVLLNNEPGADITIIDKLTYAGKLENLKSVDKKQDKVQQMRYRQQKGN